MKVLDLQCDQGHVFEGWFASEGDYQAQRQSGLLACPLCGAPGVGKLPSAPRLNLGSGGAPAGQGGPEGAALPVMQAALLKAMRRLMRETEDVGARFAEEARRIHYGETPRRRMGRARPRRP